MFLKLTNVKGDSEDAKHKGEIELTRISWGMGVTATGQSGRGGIGRAEVRELTLSKRIDPSSPLLHVNCCMGMHFDQAIVTKRKSGLAPLEYFKLTLKDVVISNIDLQLGGGDQSDFEIITLSFSEFVEEYVPQNSDGSGGPAVKHGFSIVKNIKL